MRPANDLLTITRRIERQSPDYMARRDELVSAGISCRCRQARRTSINPNRVATVMPVLSMSTICSRVNPACSPARASLETEDDMEGFGIFPPSELEILTRPGIPVSDCVTFYLQQKPTPTECRNPSNQMQSPFATGLLYGQCIKAHAP
jgi:hypothetical protein